MSLKVEDVIEKMVKAAATSFSDNWPAVKDFASSELSKIAISIVNIEYLYQIGKIQKDEAYLLLEMQKTATRSIMISLKGKIKIMMEQALNAALEAIKDMVNASIGFILIA